MLPFSSRMEKVQVSLLRSGLCLVNIFSSLMLLFVKGYTGLNPTLQEKSSQELSDAVAFVGTYFEYQFPSWYRNISFLLQVTEAGNDALPTWLYFNRSTFSLEGVPLTSDEGFTYLEVSVRDLQDETLTLREETKDVFAINVQFPGLILMKTSFLKKSENIFAKNSRSQQDEYGVHYCQTYEARFFVSLMLDFSLEKSTAEQRVHMVKNFSDFLSKKPHEIVLSMRTNDVIRRLRGVVVLESKLDQSDNVFPLLAESQLSWYIACNSFTRAEDLSRVLSHNIKSGLLQHVLGHPVVGWSLLAKMPQEERSQTQKRIRRQVNGFQTPMPTPTLTSVAPSAYRSTPSTSILQTDDITRVVTVSTFVLFTSSFTSPLNPSFTVRPTVTTVTEGRSSSVIMRTPSATLVTDSTSMASFTSVASTHLIPTSVFITPSASMGTIVSSVHPSFQTDSSVAVSSQVMFTLTQTPVSFTETTSSPSVILQTSVMSPKTTSAVLSPSTMISLAPSRPFETTSGITPTPIVTSLTSSRLLETTISDMPISTATPLTSSRLVETTSDIRLTSMVTSVTSSGFSETTSIIATSRITSVTSDISLGTTSATSPTSTLMSTTYRSSNIAPSIVFTNSQSPFIGSSQLILSSTSVPPFTSSLPVHTSVRQSLATSVTDTSRSSNKISSSYIASSTVSLPVIFSDSASIVTQSSGLIILSTSIQSPLFTTSSPVPTSIQSPLLYSTSLPVPSSVKPSFSTSIIESSTISAITSSVTVATSDIQPSLTTSRAGQTSTTMKIPSLTISETIASTSSIFPTKTSMVLQPSSTIQASFTTSQTDTFTPSLMPSSPPIKSTTFAQSSLQSLSVQTPYTPSSVQETLSTLVPITQSTSIAMSSASIISTTTLDQISTSFTSTAFSQVSRTSHITLSPSSTIIISKSPTFSPEVSSISMTDRFSSSYSQPSSSPSLSSSPLSSFLHSSGILNYFSTSTAKPFRSSPAQESISVTSQQTSSYIPPFSSQSETSLSKTASVTPITLTPHTRSSFTLTPSASLYSRSLVSSDIRFVSSLSNSEMFMTSLLLPSTSEGISVTTRITRQLSPSLSTGGRTTLKSFVPSVTSARFTPGISTPIMVTSELFSTPSMSSANIPGMSTTASSRIPVTHSTRINMTSQSISVPSLMSSRFTSTVPLTTSVNVSPARSSQVPKSSQSSLTSDTSSLEQTISVFKSSAIPTLKPSISLIGTVFSSYSTNFNVQSSFSSRDSTLLLPTTVQQMSSSMFDSSATVGSSLVTSEMISITRSLVSMTSSPSLSSDKLSGSQSSSLDSTIIASRSTLQSSSKGRTILSSMLSIETVLSSSRTRSMELSTAIPSTHILPSFTSHATQLFSTKTLQFSSVQRSSLSDSVSLDQSSFLFGSPSSIGTTKASSSSTLARPSTSKLQSSLLITSETAQTTVMPQSSSTSLTRTPFLSPSSPTFRSLSTPGTTSQLPSLTSTAIPSVSSISIPSLSSYRSPSSVVSSFQTKTSLSTAHMVTRTVTAMSTTTRATTTVRTPPLTTTPVITSSPLISRLATSVLPTKFSSLLPSHSTTGVIRGTASSSVLVTLTPSSSLRDVITSSPVIGTTASVTTEEPTTDNILTTVPRDREPYLLNPVDHIRYRSGTVFEYLIPPDTFFDKEDGSTPHLSLSLLGKDYQLVDPLSWIQLDEDKQVLFGVIVSDSSVTEVHQFFLAAVDSSGGVAYDAFKVEIYPNEINYTHQYIITLDTDFAQFTADSRNLYNFCRKLVEYYKDSLSSLNVQSVSRGSVEVAYSNNSIPESFCDSQLIEAILRQMVNADESLVPEFQLEMAKLFPVNEVSVVFLGKCFGDKTTNPPVVPKSPQIGNSMVFISLLIGLCLIFILFLIVCLLCMYCLKKRPGEEYLLAEEKIVYTKNRKPVILNNDRDIQKPPRRTYPAVLPDDISPFRSEQKVTPPMNPVPPPSYKPSPTQDNFLELGDFEHFPHYNPPSGYSAPPVSGLLTRQDPPEYQQPPPYYPSPYYPSQKNSDSGEFQTTHF